MQKDNEIRNLRAQHKQKEMILKRKQEEVIGLLCTSSAEALHSIRRWTCSRSIYSDVKCVPLVFVRQPKQWLTISLLFNKAYDS